MPGDVAEGDGELSRREEAVETISTRSPRIVPRSPECIG